MRVLAPDLDRGAVDTFFLEGLASPVQFIQRSYGAHPDAVIGVLAVDGDGLNAGLHAHHCQFCSETFSLYTVAEGADLQVIGTAWGGRPGAGRWLR